MQQATVIEDEYVFNFSEEEALIFREKEDINVAELADKIRIISKGNERIKWKNDITPYAVFPMECWTNPYIQKITLCWAPQTSKTQVAINCIVYCAINDPGPAMYVMADEKTSKRINKRQIRPSLEATPEAAELLSDKADDITSLQIGFKNGMDIMTVWASSPAAIASESVRYMFYDEPGKYPEFSGKEADSLSLGDVRQNAYPFTKKSLYYTTPNREGDVFDIHMKEEVEVWYHLEVPCPWCGKYQKIEFEYIHWPNKIRDPNLVKRKKLAVYSPPCCGGMEWDDIDLNNAVKKCRWVPDVDIKNAISVGFHLPSWYSPFISLSDVAAAFLKGLKDPKKMMAFETQHKAISFCEKIKQKNEDELLKLKTDMPEGVVPEGSVALTCGIDVQMLGFWFVVRAWDSKLNSDLIQYGYLSTWKDVENLIFNTRYPVQNSSETMAVWRCGMDIGGGKSENKEWTRTDEIKDWIRINGRGVVHAVKGASRKQYQNVFLKIQERTVIKNKVHYAFELRHLDTDSLKGLLHWRFERKPFVNEDSEDLNKNIVDTHQFRLHSGTDISYAKQVLAEERKKNRKGVAAWRQIRSDNHYLDCEVYAAACADPSWTPSLQFIANNADKKPVKKNKTVKKTSSGRKIPNWFKNR